MEFIDSGWVTAAGATVGTIAVAILAVVFWKWKDDNVWTRRLVYVLALGLIATGLVLNFQERRTATTIAGEVGKTLDVCRETLDTLNGSLIAKLIAANDATVAQQIALQMKDTIDQSKCVRP